MIKDVIELNQQMLELKKTDLDQIPGDKSVSHRAAILGSLSNQQVMFKRYSMAEDCLHSLQVMQDLGVDIKRIGRDVLIQGVGLKGLKAPNKPLDVGNSGTLIRLILGVLAAQPFQTVISGDQSIESRPMKRIIDPLGKMGANIEGRHENGDILAPLTVHPVKQLSGIHYKMPVASAQVKSAVLLAGLFADTPVQLDEPAKSRDHTERFLKAFNQPVELLENGLSLQSVGALSHSDELPELLIPADLSSALFMIVLALFTEGSLTLRGIGLNPSRRAAIDVLIESGAQLEFLPCKEQSFEPVADIVIKQSTLSSMNIQGDRVPNLIDEIPILTIAAIAAGQKISVRDAAELRVKESDRIDGICRLLRAMGAQVDEKENGFDASPSKMVAEFEYDANHDHRLAMSAIIASLILGIKSSISGCESISTSFPNFFEILKELGYQP